MGEKEEFRKKLEAIEDPKILIDKIPIQKKKVEDAQAAYDLKRTAYQDFIGSDTIKTAFDEAELAKRDLSIESWKMSEACQRLDKLARDQDSKSGTFGT